MHVSFSKSCAHAFNCFFRQVVVGQGIVPHYLRQRRTDQGSDARALQGIKDKDEGWPIGQEVLLPAGWICPSGRVVEPSKQLRLWLLNVCNTSSPSLPSPWIEIGIFGTWRRVRWCV